MGRVRIALRGPGGVHGGEVELSGALTDDRKATAEALRAASAYVADGHADGIFRLNAERPPIVYGDDGHAYAPAEFCDSEGVPVAGLRRLTDEELAELTGGEGAMG